MVGETRNIYAGEAILKALRGARPLRFLYSIRIARYLFREFLSPLLLSPSIPKCKGEIAKLSTNDVSELVSFAMERWRELIGPLQVKEEISELLQIVKGKNIRTFLEIGTGNGGTLFLFSRVASDGARAITIDLPGGAFGGGYSSFKSGFYRSFARPGQEIMLIKANSHDESVKQKVAAMLGEGKLDLLFIDGDHTYEGVKQDFELYSGLVRPGGIIALHDIVVHPPESDCNVNKFWDEVKVKYKSREIIHDKNQGWGGIGVIYVAESDLQK
jgi:predicted O-methyltransferase YrrM